MYLLAVRRASKSPTRHGSSPLALVSAHTIVRPSPPSGTAIHLTVRLGGVHPKNCKSNWIDPKLVIQLPFTLIKVPTKGIYVKLTSRHPTTTTKYHHHHPYWGDQNVSAALCGEELRGINSNQKSKDITQ